MLDSINALCVGGEYNILGLLVWLRDVVFGQRESGGYFIWWWCEVRGCWGYRGEEMMAVGSTGRGEWRGGMRRTCGTGEGIIAYDEEESVGWKSGDK